MYYAILSDIHGNMVALQSIILDMQQFDIRGIILLGDLIDYGMESNEVVSYIKNNNDHEIVCNIWGNHERAILLQDYSKFSSQRGVDCAKNTAKLLSIETKEYLENCMVKDGIKEFKINNKKCLSVHGSLEDHYWKAISPDDVRGDYCKYDVVFSGHSHYSHMFSKFYNAEDPDRRNKHAVMFINPGSVGQPRNHNPRVQYALADFGSMSVQLRAVEYDVESAMSLYDGNVDSFYKNRLRNGI